MIVKNATLYNVPFDEENRDVFVSSSQKFLEFINENYKKMEMTNLFHSVRTNDDGCEAVFAFHGGHIQLFSENFNYVMLEDVDGNKKFYFVIEKETLNNITDDTPMVVTKVSIKCKLKFDVFANYIDIIIQPQQKHFLKRCHIEQYEGDPTTVITDLQSPSFSVKPNFGEYDDVAHAFPNDVDVLFKVYGFPRDSAFAGVSTTGVNRRFNWNYNGYYYGSDSMVYFFVPVKAYIKHTTFEYDRSTIKIYDGLGNEVLWERQNVNSTYADFSGEGSLVFIKYTFMVPFYYSFDKQTGELWVRAYSNQLDYGESSYEDYKNFSPGTMFFAPIQGEEFKGWELLTDCTEMLNSLSVEYPYPVDGRVSDPLDIIRYNPVLRRFPFSHLQMKIGSEEYVPIDTKYVVNNSLKIYYQPCVDGARYYFVMKHGEDELMLDNFENIKFVNGGQALPYSIDSYSSYMRNHGESLTAKHETKTLLAVLGLVASLTTANYAGTAISATSLFKEDYSHRSFVADLSNAVDSTNNSIGGNLDDVYCDRIVFRLATFNRLKNTNYNTELIRDCMYYGYEYNQYDYPFNRVTWYYKYIQTLEAKMVSICNLKHRKEIEEKMNRGLTLWFLDDFNSITNSLVKNLFLHLNKDIVNPPISIKT